MFGLRGFGYGLRGLRSGLQGFWTDMQANKVALDTCKRVTFCGSRDQIGNLTKKTVFL